MIRASMLAAALAGALLYADPNATSPVSSPANENERSSASEVGANPKTRRFEAGSEGWIEFERDDRTRRCLVHVGAAVEPESLAPLVLVFHGAGANADWQKGYCGLAREADREGYIAAFPDGTGRLGRWLLTWNAGSCCGYATSEGVDDVAFIDELLDRLLRELPVDASRVYAVGLSNGGMMCYRLARELPDRIAAIGVVSGTHLGDPPASRDRAVPVIHFHGTEDRLVPFEGGSPREWMPTHGFRSAPDSASLWANHAGCEPTPDVTELPDRAEDGTRVRRRSWTGGRDGSRVVLYEIEGGGHTWPGRVFFAGIAAPAWSRRFSLLGRTSEDIDANALLWEFFRAHPMPENPEAPRGASTSTPLDQESEASDSTDSPDSPRSPEDR